MGIISLDPEQYQEIAQKDLKHVIPRLITIASIHPHTLSYFRALLHTFFSFHQHSLETHLVNDSLILPSQCIIILKAPTLSTYPLHLLYQPIISTHPLNPLPQTTFSTHHLRYLPMLVPPKRWDNKKTRDGCYFRLKSSIVRSNSRMQIEAVRRANIGPVLEGLDYLGQVMCLGYQWTTPFYHVPPPPCHCIRSVYLRLTYIFYHTSSHLHYFTHVLTYTLHIHRCLGASI